MWLHNLEIVHCDLTSENIILSPCNIAKIAKIGNYGPKFVRSEFDSNHYNIPLIIVMPPQGFFMFDH